MERVKEEQRKKVEKRERQSWKERTHESTSVELTFDLFFTVIKRRLKTSENKRALFSIHDRKLKKGTVWNFFIQSSKSWQICDHFYFLPYDSLMRVKCFSDAKVSH